MINKYEKLKELISSSSENTRARARRRLYYEYNMRDTVYSVYQLTQDALDANILIYEIEKKQEIELEKLCSHCYTKHLPSHTIYQSPKKEALSLGSFLDIAKHAVSVADILGFNVGQISSVITGLKVIDRAMSKENISVKDISLATEIIAEYAKYYEKNESERNKITISSAAFSLAIDFLNKQR